jgi:saccharopine dehydrogenase-like NADP-dependent oxidoreductase
MRVIVVGGSGHLGSRAVEALRALPGGTDVRVAGRSGEVRVDLNDSSTFGALDADVIVDLANTSVAPPYELARHCIENGKVLLEATSDTVVIEELHRRFKDAKGTGAVVLGAGIFTGVSNLLGRAVATPGTKSLQMGISVSPFSAAGAGTIALMTDLLGIDTSSWVDGQRVSGPPVSKGPRLPFPRGEAPTLHAPLAEAFMLHTSTGVPNVKLFFSPRPTFLQLVFLMTPIALLKTRFFRWFLGIYFTVLRRVLLSWKATPVEMVAIADGRKMTVLAPDGMRAGGEAIARMCQVLAQRKPEKPVVFVDDVMTLEELKVPGVIVGH